MLHDRPGHAVRYAEVAHLARQRGDVLAREAAARCADLPARDLARLGELHDLADFLTALEFGPLRVSIPFIELIRRGAMVRKQGVGRTVSATIQISGVVQGTAQLAKVQKVAAGAEPANAPEAPATGAAAPAVAAPPAGLGQAPAPPAAEEDRPAVPDDPLGTGQMVTPP